MLPNSGLSEGAVKDLVARPDAAVPALKGEAEAVVADGSAEGVLPNSGLNEGAVEGVDGPDAAAVVLNGEAELVAFGEDVVAFAWRSEDPDALLALTVSEGSFAAGGCGGNILVDELESFSVAWAFAGDAVASPVPTMSLNKLDVCDLGVDSGPRTRLTLSLRTEAPSRATSSSAFRFAFAFVICCSTPLGLSDVAAVSASCESSFDGAEPPLLRESCFCFFAGSTGFCCSLEACFLFPMNCLTGPFPAARMACFFW